MGDGLHMSVEKEDLQLWCHSPGEPHRHCTDEGGQMNKEYVLNGSPLMKFRNKNPKQPRQKLVPTAGVLMRGRQRDPGGKLDWVL